MRKSTYSKILLAPIAALILGACSSKLHNQSQEYDDIYFSTADRNKATQTDQLNQPILAPPEEKLQIVTKTHSSQEYSPQYVDPALVDKFNNNQTQSTANQAGLIVKSVNDLSYSNFVSDYNKNYVEYRDLPLEWGDGYWSQIQFDNRVSSDYQFRNAWYDYYYNGYEGSLNNYFEQVESNQSYASNNNFYAPISFRPRVRFSFIVGYGYANSRFYSPYRDPFYDPYFIRPYPYPYYGFTNPLFTSANVIIGSSFWCPPTYSNRPSYANYPYYPSSTKNPGKVETENGRIITNGPRNGRRVIASVQDDLTNGTSPGTRSEANMNSNALNGRKSINYDYSKASSSSAIVGGRINKTSINNIDDVTDFPSRSRTSAVTVSSRDSRISSDDYSFSRRTKTRKSSNVRSRTSNDYIKPSKDNFNRSSRNAKSVTSFSRIDHGASQNSRNGYSRPSSSRSSTNYNKSSNSRSSGISRSIPSRSRSTTPVKRSSSSTRSTSSSKSSGTTMRSKSTKSSSASNKSGRSNE